MKTFNDNSGRSWTIEVNVATVKRVRTLTGVNLLEVVEGTLIERFIRDPVLLCDVVYAVCKPQADERQPPVSDEEFGRAMAGDAIEHATTALLEELVSFSPSPRDRKNLGRVLEATKRVMDKARDLIETRLESGELERAAERALAELAQQDETRNASSGSAPASPASIHPP
jgi:hypothetical protein